MRAIVDRGQLAEALALCGRSVVARTPKPILECVHVAADDSGLALRSTDLSVWVEGCRVDRADIEDTGEVAVSHAKLAGLVRNITDPTVRLASGPNGSATLTTTGGSFTIHGTDPAGMPKSPKPGEVSAEVDAAELLAAVSSVSGAIASETDRYAMNGVLLDADAIVATDGHRLNRYAFRLGEVGAPGIAPPIMPRAMWRALMPVLEACGEERVSVSLDKSRLVVTTPVATVAGAIVEGNFPPYRDIIPRQTKHYRVRVAETVAALKRVASFATEESKGVRLTFDDKAVSVSSATELGSGNERVELAEGGELFEIGVNPSYLLDAFAACGSEVVELATGDAPNKPITVEDGPLLCVLMPINLTGTGGGK